MTVASDLELAGWLCWTIGLGAILAERIVNRLASKAFQEAIQYATKWTNRPSPTEETRAEMEKEIREELSPWIKKLSKYAAALVVLQICSVAFYVLGCVLIIISDLLSGHPGYAALQVVILIFVFSGPWWNNRKKWKKKIKEKVEEVAGKLVVVPLPNPT